MAVEVFKRVRQLEELNAPGDVRRGFVGDWSPPGRSLGRTDCDDRPGRERGSCVARHDGRVVFVRYALPGELVRVRVTAERGAYCHAEVVEGTRASTDRIESLCPIAAGPTAGRMAQGAVIWPSPTRCGAGDQRGRLSPISLPGLRITPGRASPSRLDPDRRADGEPGCGWVSIPPAGRDSTATTALTWSPICGAVSCPSMLAGIEGPGGAAGTTCTWRSTTVGTAT